MASDYTHDARDSWWNGDVVTLCGQRFPGGKGWKDAFFGPITCPNCKAAKKKAKR